MKKTILGLGSAAAIIAPIAGVVACGTSDEKEKEKTLKEILASKVLVLKSEDAALADSALLAAIKKQLEMDYGLELKKAHMLSVTADKSGGSTLAAITVTTDETAKMAYVTVKVNDEEAKDDAKNIEIKVRKETDKEYNARVVETLKKHLEMKHGETAKALDLALNVVNGISNASSYTTAKALVSLEAKIKAEMWATPAIDSLIDAATTTIEIKKFGDTAAEASGNNTIDLATAKKIEIEISSTKGEAADKAGPTMVSFYVKAT